MRSLSPFYNDIFPTKREKNGAKLKPYVHSGTPYTTYVNFIHLISSHFVAVISHFQTSNNGTPGNYNESFYKVN